MVLEMRHVIQKAIYRVFQLAAVHTPAISEIHTDAIATSRQCMKTISATSPRRILFQELCFIPMTPGRCIQPYRSLVDCGSQGTSNLRTGKLQVSVQSLIRYQVPCQPTIIAVGLTIGTITIEVYRDIFGRDRFLEHLSFLVS